MDLAQRGDDGDGEAQEASHLHRRAEQPLERLAAGILEHQYGPAAFMGEIQRQHRPSAIKLIFQAVFVGKAIEAGGCRVLRDGRHRQHGIGRAISAPAASAGEDTLAVLPEYLEATIPTRSE